MRKILARQLYSTAGERGIEELEKRITPWLNDLEVTWSNRKNEGGVKKLGKIIGDIIENVDQFDLRPAEIKLRPVRQGSQIPVGIFSKITRSLIQYLSKGDLSCEDVVLAKLSAVEITEIANQRGSLRDFGFRMSYAEFLLEQNKLDQALKIIEENLTYILCSYNEHFLWRILSIKKKQNLISSSSKIGLHDFKGKFCEQPFVTLSSLTPATSVKNDGEPPLFACSCPGQMPYQLNAMDLKNLDHVEDIWNGPVIQELRRSILDGDYTYCSRMLCARALNGSLENKEDITDPIMKEIIENNRTKIDTPPRFIVLSHDETCNIACPSCREEIIAVKNDARKKMDKFTDKHILPLLDDANTYICLSGDGDPFASKHYRRFLQNLDPIKHGNLMIDFQTNGLLLNPDAWQSFSHIHHAIRGARVSIDAATAETYEDVRRPGKWSQITENMEFMAELRRSGKFKHLCICFVVQKKNYKEMPAFVELGKKWAADEILFSRLFPVLHSGSQNVETFNQNAIAEEAHPEHSEFLKVLSNPIMKSKEVNLTNIATHSMEERAPQIENVA